MTNFPPLKGPHNFFINWYQECILINLHEKFSWNCFYKRSQLFSIIGFFKKCLWHIFLYLSVTPIGRKMSYRKASIFHLEMSDCLNNKQLSINHFGSIRPNFSDEYTQPCTYYLMSSSAKSNLYEYMFGDDFGVIHFHPDES